MPKINTLPELKAAIKSADEVLMMPRVGGMTVWVKVPKYEAQVICNILLDSWGEDATPRQCEMYGSCFGELVEGRLYFG